MGSPRANGNTARLLQHLSETAPEGVEVEIITLNDYKINGCIGCSSCQRNADCFKCVQQDDANYLLQKIIDADAVVYAAPLYGHNYSGQLNIFLDRNTPLFKFVEGSDKAINEMKILSAIENKPVGLMVSCQGPVEYNTELVQMLFDEFGESSLACCLGKYIFPFCDTEAQKSYYDENIFKKIHSEIMSDV